MTTEATAPDGPKSPVASDYVLVALWSLLVVVVAVVMGYTAIATLRQYRADALRLHQERMDPNVTEPGYTPADVALPPGARPNEVRVGVYVDRITDLSLESDAWTASFYIWFNWNDGRGDSCNWL